MEKRRTLFPQYDAKKKLYLVLERAKKIERKVGFRIFQFKRLFLSNDTNSRSNAQAIELLNVPKVLNLLYLFRTTNILLIKFILGLKESQ